MHKTTGILTVVGKVLSVDTVEVVIGLVAHWGDAMLVGDVIECDELPGQDDEN